MKYTKLLLIVSLFFLSISASANRGLKNRKEFFYSESINIFTVLDQVSAWSPRHNLNYRKLYEEKFGLNLEEKDLIEKYIKIRTKYLHKIPRKKLGNHLFPQDSIDMDKFSRSFFMALTLNDGLLNLQKVIPSKEFRVIKDFYQYFVPKIQPWILESKTFETYLKNFKKKYDKGKGKQIVNKLKKFFNLDKKEMSKIYMSFAWAPEFERPTVDMMSNVFVLKIHPTTGMAKPDFKIIMTELVDAMLDAQPEGQKASFTTQFAKECEMDQIPPKMIIKWPLAVAGGAMMFESNLTKKEFDITQNWSKNPWVHNYSKQLFILLERAVKKRDHLVGNFLRQSGVACQNLINLHSYLKSLEEKEK